MSKKKKKKKVPNRCLICGDPCDVSNVGEWVELDYMGRKERRVRSCRKHDGVVEEFKRQQEE